MALNAKKALAAANQYTDETVIGGGALKGKNCTIDSIEPISGGQRVTFKWTLDNGTEQTTTMDVMNGQDGKGIKSVAINEESHLIITYTDDTTQDAGQIEITAAVDSVNGKIGEVVLTASDVGALPSDTAIPSKTSDLTNDSNFAVDANYVHTDNNYDATAKDVVDNVTTALAGKVDKETGKSLIDLTTVVDGASYDSTNHLILFKNGTTTLFSLDAAAFVKDGMVDDVEISGGNLVITFNTDAGKQAISIPLTDIFDPANYYDKTATDNLLADKVSKSNTAGLLKNDGTVDTNTYATTSQLPDITGKADKVSGATNGNFAGLDSNGNLTDSGKKASDFATPENVQDSINTSADLLKDTVGWTGKNLLKNTATTQTVEGVTFTVNSDGSVLANGTGTGNQSQLTLGDRNDGVNAIRLKKGKYTINGSVSVGNIHVATSSNTDGSYLEIPNSHSTKGDDATFEITDAYLKTGTDYCPVSVYLQIGANVANNLTFYPMIRRADIADSTYEPYHESVETMCEEEIHGVNLFNDSKIEVGKAWNGDTNANRARNIIPCEPNSEYIVSMNGTNGLDAIFFSASASIPPASQSAITSFPYTIRTGASDRYITLGFNKTDIALSDVTALKIMLRKATIEDGTYRPYNYQAIQNQLNDKGVLGAKNLFNFDTPTVTRSGVTFENNGGIITANGTGTDVGFPYIECRKTLPAGTYILTGCPSGGGDVANPDNYQIIVRLNDPSGPIIALDYGDGSTFTLDQSSVVSMRCMTSKNMTVTNLIYKPMLRLASDPDDTYQPYAMTNRELTEEVNALPREIFVTTDTRTTTTNDANTLPCGFTRMNDANSNLPTDGTGGNVWYDILTVRQSNDSSKENWGYGFQLAVQTTTNANMGDMYVRAVNGGATPRWSEWKKLN